MLKHINRLFILVALVIAAVAIAISITTIGVTSLLGHSLEMDRFSSLEIDSEVQIAELPLGIQPDASPYTPEIIITTPPLAQKDLLFVEVYGDKRLLAEVDCLEQFESPEDYIGLSELACSIPIPYNYDASEIYQITAVLTKGETESASEPSSLLVNWADYENNFWGFSLTISLFLGLAYVFILFPVTLGVAYLAVGMKHRTEFDGEFSLSSLLAPLRKGRSILQNLNTVLISPYFWLFEIAGILLILTYMAVEAEIWKSGTAFVAFTISGAAAFAIPYILCVAWWYLEYREREPIRVLVTLFLWGMLSALMAIGLNTIVGVLFGIIGIGFISTLLFAPPTEEFFKSIGLGLLSEHHEYDSVEDGMVYGFVIGMGFAFIENWIYFLNNPMGSDIWGWMALFLLRSVMFSANHGFFTAITGAVIGYLIEKKFAAPALGILVGVPLATFFHSMHNSGEMLGALLGGGGLLLYCCFLIPLFDYGGLIFIILLFAYFLLRKRR